MKFEIFNQFTKKKITGEQTNVKRMSPWKLVSIFKKGVFSDAIEVIIKSKAQI